MRYCLSLFLLGSSFPSCDDILIFILTMNIEYEMCYMWYRQSEQHELFSNVSVDHLWGDLKDIEVDSLGQRSAFSHQGDISNLYVEGWGAVGSDVSVSFLVSVVFGDVVKIVASHDDGSLHFSAENDSFKNLSSNSDVAGEGTLLVDVLSFDSFLGCLEVESDVLIVPDSSAGLFGEEFLTVEED